MKKEAGFTLVEMVIAVALTGILAVILGPAVHQMVMVTDYGNDKLTALHELQNAAYWFNADSQMSVSATGGGSLTLTLAAGQTITYSLSGANLQRTSDSGTMTLAQSISSASFTVADRLATMDLTAIPQGRAGVSEQGTYQAYLRPVTE